MGILQVTKSDDAHCAAAFALKRSRSASSTKADKVRRSFFASRSSCCRISLGRCTVSRSLGFCSSVVMIVISLQVVTPHVGMDTA
jgi:hypothetical protein